MTLLDLKRYAIELRSEISFGNQHGHACVVNEKGMLRIPGEDKNFRAEEILAAAEMFEIVSDGQARRLTREALISAITEAFGKKRAETGAAEDE